MVRENNGQPDGVRLPSPHSRRDMSEPTLCVMRNEGNNFFVPLSVFGGFFSLITASWLHRITAFPRPIHFFLSMCALLLLFLFLLSLQLLRCFYIFLIFCMQKKRNVYFILFIFVCRLNNLYMTICFQKRFATLNRHFHGVFFSFFLLAVVIIIIVIYSLACLSSSSTNNFVLSHSS